MYFHIREAREAAGLSQKDLAKIIGVAPSTLNGYESGKHDPKSDLLVKIAIACHVTTDYLLCHNRQQQKSPAPASELSDAEWELVEIYRRLNIRGRERLLEYARETAQLYTGDSGLAVSEAAG